MLYSCYNCKVSGSVCDYHNEKISKINQGPHWNRYAVVYYNDIQLMTGRGVERLVDHVGNIITEFVDGNISTATKAGDPNEVTKVV